MNFLYALVQRIEVLCRIDLHRFPRRGQFHLEFDLLHHFIRFLWPLNVQRHDMALLDMMGLGFQLNQRAGADTVRRLAFLGRGGGFLFERFQGKKRQVAQFFHLKKHVVGIGLLIHIHRIIKQISR